MKRLAASVVIAGARQRLQRRPGPRGDDALGARLSPVDGSLRGDAPDRRLVHLITDTDIREAGEATGLLAGRAGAPRRAALETIFTKARRRDGMRAFESLTGVVDGRRVILDDPPVITHVDIAGQEAVLEKVFTDYRATMPENRRDFLERYRFVDFALKVVGVGSVGTRCYVIVLEGRDENDPLILQAKEATASVMEPYLGASLHEQPRLSGSWSASS